jgi:hypothetical protein
VEPTIQGRQYQQARIAIVPSGIPPNQGRIPIKVRHTLEGQTPFSDIPGVLRRIKRDRHTP